jgi:RES domain-containing protein
VIVYRIGSRRYPANDGTGASLYPGRWNPPGIPVIYTAQTSSLCALEILAGARELAGDYVVVEIEIPDDIPIETLQEEDLPPDWNADVHPESTRAIGRNWVASGRSAVLSVPSTTNRYERNFVLNPAHADFQRFSFGEPEPFAFPSRLKRRI